jgi:xanthosine utilization system XapX-like protein
MGQLTFVLNMFFGLAVGELAFSFTLLKDNDFSPAPCPKFAFQIGLVSLCIAVQVAPLSSRDSLITATQQERSERMTKKRKMHLLFIGTSQYS